MAHPPNAARGVEALLRELGPRLQRGGLPEESRPRFASGLAAIDALLGGGFPRGRLCEVAGTASSGRTSLALALLARATRAGEFCAVVDAADGFDPLAAEAAGVVLPRVLWVRAPALRPALRGSLRLLEARGFGLVLLNLAGEAPAACDPAERSSARSPAATSPTSPVWTRLAPTSPVWTRLARSAAAGDAALVVLGLGRTTGTAAELALEMSARRALFTGTPPLLEAVEVEARLVRSRGGAGLRCARVRLHAPGVAAGPERGGEP
jgi:hypothetical protein